MQTFLFISIGAVLGANARYWFTNWAAHRWAGEFPIGTALINLSGSFLLGFLLAMAAERLEINERLAALLIVGFLGSYTTFSTYTIDSVQMMLNGRWTLGLANLIGGALIGGLAAVLGVYLGQLVPAS
jgi:CrcB protein